MLLSVIFVLNVVIHVAIGAYILMTVLKGQGTKTTWQQSGLLTLAVVLGMHLITKALGIFHVPGKWTLAVVGLWTLFGSGVLLSTTVHLRKHKLYLVTAIWAVALFVLGFLIGVLDRLLLFGI